MKARHVWGIAVVVALGASVVLAAAGAPADAGVPEARITVSKQKSGPFREDLKLNLDPGQAKILYLKVRNVDNDELNTQLMDGGNPNLALKWFTRWRGGENITAEVEANYDLDLQPGQVKKFRWKVKLISGAGCAETHVTWPISGSDFVRARVNANACS